MLTNQDNRKKRDLAGVRTPEDVMRRLADNVKITTDEVKGLTIEVSGKVGNDEIISRINQSAEAVTIDANKININGTISANGNFKVDTSGNMTCNNATMNNTTMNTATMNNANINEGFLKMTAPNGSVTNIGAYEGITIEDNSLAPTVSLWAQMTADGIYFHNDGTAFASAMYGESNMLLADSNHNDTIYMTGETGHIDCVSLTQTSREEAKKNFEKLDSGLNIIKDVDIYKYNFKRENDDTKKHIGFVIGEDYKYREELTDVDNKGVDLYSFISVCCKAIQELQEEVEELKKKVNK